MDGGPLLQRLAATPVYRPLLELRRLWQVRQVMGAITPPSRTCYCVSPYKTGTTYIAGLFQEHHRVVHEPLQYATLRRVEDVDFMRFRQAFLSLDLECSGFFSAHLSLLKQVAPEAPLLFVSRAPDEWIGSLLNYFEQLDMRVAYNYLARLFFDPVCGHPVERFYRLDDWKQHDVVVRLLDFWSQVYSAAVAEPHALVVDLSEVDRRLPDIEDHFALRASRKPGIWRRETPRKKPFCIRDYVDAARYQAKVASLGYSL